MYTTLVKMCYLSITDLDVLSKYASKGYFSYKYILSLGLGNSCDNLLKNNGVINSYNTNNEIGSYIDISILDLVCQRKIEYTYYSSNLITNIVVGDLIEFCEGIYINLKINAAKCFIKFDIYTLSDREDEPLDYFIE